MKELSVGACSTLCAVAFCGFATIVAEDKSADQHRILFPPVCYKVNLGEWGWDNEARAAGLPKPGPEWIPPSRIKLDIRPQTEPFRPPWRPGSGLPVRPDGVVADSRVF